MKPKSVAVVGVYPPPYGGISVHIERLCDALEVHEIPFVIYDGSEAEWPQQAEAARQPTKNIVPIPHIEKWCLRYLFLKNEDVIHNHFLRWQVRFLLALCKLKGKRVVHTFHSLRNEELRYSFAHRFMIRITGLLSDHFIVVSDDIKQKLIKLHIPERKISVIPGFIPPDIGDRKERASDAKLNEPSNDASNDQTKKLSDPLSSRSVVNHVLPNYIEDFYQKHDQVILANGGVGNLYLGDDLYGLDLCLEMMERLVGHRRKASTTAHSADSGTKVAGHSGEAEDRTRITEDRESHAAEAAGGARAAASVGLVYCVTHIVNPQALKDIEEQIEQLGLQEHILLVYEKMPLYPLIQRSDLFIRPTSSDGDAISIREALYCGVPVVASDAVWRPAGVLLHTNRDAADLAEKCRLILTDPTVAKELENTTEDQSIYLLQVLDILQG